MAFEIDNQYQDIANIKVIGVGGGGGNAVDRMAKAGISGVELIAINTDQQALARSLAGSTLQIGQKVTSGRGAGAKPEVGQKSAEESRDSIVEKLDGAQMVFVTAGMGGGTGTGAAPIIAEIAKDRGILTVGIVTKPFAFEGSHRMKQAEAGIAELAQHVDSLIVIPNERLKYVSEQKITFANAFSIADDVLRQGVNSVTDLITMPAFINLDFADVTSVMKDAGHAHMGIGRASGKDKAEQAANSAISSPLLETTITGAKGVIISITASPDITLEDVDTAAGIVRAQADEDANIIFGVAFDEKLDDEMIVTVIATGFGLDANGISKRPTYSDPMSDISSSSNFGAADDDMGDILDLFKSRR